jgi:outer membrane protein TolC
MPTRQPTEARAVAITNENRKPTAEGIARRAYALYEERGRVDGADLDDWLQAERELTQSTPRTS